jgi:hypothetical protein
VEDKSHCSISERECEAELGSEDVSKSANLPGEIESALWFDSTTGVGLLFLTGDSIPTNYCGTS